MFGDFEDLETGEVHKADDNEHSEGEVQGDENDESEQSKTGGEEDRLEKKKKQKAAFNAMYPSWFVLRTKCEHYTTSAAADKAAL